MAHLGPFSPNGFITKKQSFAPFPCGLYAGHQRCGKSLKHAKATGVVQAMHAYEKSLAYLPSFADPFQMLMTQIYTLLGSPDLLPNHTLSAKFAVYQLHKSVAAGITFVASRYMLDAQGAPKMEIWMPLHIGILGLGVAGVWMLLFKRRKRDSRIGGDSLA